MVYWIDENGNRHNGLPLIWKGITPFSETRANELGWTRFEELEPDPSPDGDDEGELDIGIVNAEENIIRAIYNLAKAHNACAMLVNCDFNIPSLLDLAGRVGDITKSELQETITEILLFSRQLEAVSGRPWHECWEGLKSRAATYIATLDEERQFNLANGAPASYLN